jgi:hypothetical protein
MPVGNTALNNPIGLALHPAGNIYVTGINLRAISVLAAGRSGNVEAIRIISGFNTTLDCVPFIAF